MTNSIAAWLASCLFAGLAAAAGSVCAQGTQPSSGEGGESAQGLRITRSGSQPSAAGSAENFTGRVRVDTSFRAESPGRAGGALVTFDAGARTAWHTHPLGQTLIVTQGLGYVQRWGGPVQEIRPGDVVWIPAGEKHWHGATATNGMSHLAVGELLDGKSVDWLEKVSDAQYPASKRPQGESR